jgi:ArsR family transcriptional regulator, arsenate/arsenite/antimonite-responsive transcriptional repressor
LGVVYVKAHMMYNAGMGDRKNQRSLDRFFRALADPTRLRLLNLIAEGEICVCYFVAILGISQPKVSRHLAYLRKAGLVASRREGKWMHYRLPMGKDATTAGILRETLKHLRRNPELRRDIARLSSACCAPKRTNASLARLSMAPRPARAPRPMLQGRTLLPPRRRLTRP